MKLQHLCLALCLALCSCGGSDDHAVSAVPPPPGVDAAAEPIERTSVRVVATEETKQIALQRLEIMQQITTVLKPLRDPAAALSKEAELESLFAQYNELGQQAAEQGLKGRPLAALTDHLAPESSRDARTEFFMYLGIVRQLGPEQREMLDRVMGQDDRAPDESSEETE